MSKYLVIGKTKISLSTIVEANSLEEAREIADERYIQSLQNDGNPFEEWVHSGEIDADTISIIEDIQELN